MRGDYPGRVIDENLWSTISAECAGMLCRFAIRPDRSRPDLAQGWVRAPDEAAAREFVGQGALLFPQPPERVWPGDGNICVVGAHLGGRDWEADSDYERKVRALAANARVRSVSVLTPTWGEERRSGCGPLRTFAGSPIAAMQRLRTGQWHRATRPCRPRSAIRDLPAVRRTKAQRLPSQDHR